MVDWILENLISDNRTRRGVIKKLKEMCLVVNSKSTKTAVQKRAPKEWSEEEIAQLTELWEKVREDEGAANVFKIKILFVDFSRSSWTNRLSICTDPVDTIHDALTVKRSKKVIKEKLLEIGLANDRKELRKKRRRHGEPPKSSWEPKSASEQSDSDSADDEDRPRKEEKPNKRQPMVVYTDQQLLGLVKDVINKSR